MSLRLSLVAALALTVGCATTTPAAGANTGTSAAAVQSGDACDVHHQKDHAHADGKACDCAGKGEQKGECCKGEAQKGDCCKGKAHTPDGAACGCGKAHDDGKACGCGGAVKKAEAAGGCGCQHG
jgi:hypothetical protein